MDSRLLSMMLPIQVLCRMVPCTESSPPSRPWSQLQGSSETVIEVLTPCSGAKGRSGKAGASAPPSHTHAMPPISCTGKCANWMPAMNCSTRWSWVGHSTTLPETSIFQP